MTLSFQTSRIQTVHQKKVFKCFFGTSTSWIRARDWGSIFPEMLFTKWQKINQQKTLNLPIKIVSGSIYFVIRLKKYQKMISGQLRLRSMLVKHKKPLNWFLGEWQLTFVVGKGQRGYCLYSLYGGDFNRNFYKPFFAGILVKQPGVSWSTTLPIGGLKVGEPFPQWSRFAMHVPFWVRFWISPKKGL